MQHRSRQQTAHPLRGFTLVELSIVLVIIALLVGGVLAGQSLIRASELRAVVTEYNSFKTAQNAFREKYAALPGDMVNATAYWGKDNAACTGHTGTAATPGTCNGDNSGILTAGGGANATGEIYRYWQQLALAGLIAGTYSGNAGSGNNIDSNNGVNVPSSKLAGAGWSIYSWGTVAINGTGLGNFEGDYWNTFLYGGDKVNLNEQGVMKAEEAWNIDTKIDDGRPGLGIMRVFEAATNCQDAGTSTTVALSLTANYKLSDTTKTACSIIFESN